MPLHRIILASLLLVFSLALGAYAMAKRTPIDSWNFYHFDGLTFVAGPASGGPFIAVCERHVPLLLTKLPPPTPVDSLPAGKGALAGICYIQTAGGKLATPGFQPCSGTAITLHGSAQAATAVTTDQNGYFTAVLPPGVYTIGTPPLATEAVVSEGITTLVSLRAGKRMVD